MVVQGVSGFSVVVNGGSMSFSGRCTELEGLSGSSRFYSFVF